MLTIMPPWNRQLSHPALASQGPRRLLVPQHADLVPAVRVRPEDLGVAGGQGLGVQGLHAHHGQAAQLRPARPRPPPQPAVQGLGAGLQRRHEHSRYPQLQRGDHKDRLAQAGRRLLQHLVQPRRPPPLQRLGRLHPPHPARRGAAPQPDHPDQRLGRPHQRPQRHRQGHQPRPARRLPPHRQRKDRDHPGRRGGRHPPPHAALRPGPQGPAPEPRHPRLQGHPRCRREPPGPPRVHHHVGAQQARAPGPDHHGL